MTNKSGSTTSMSTSTKTDISDVRDVRAVALLGEKPLVTLIDPNDAGASLSVRLWRAAVGPQASASAWLAIIDDGAALLDRVRMGLRPAFLVHHDATTPTISGELDVKIVGPAANDPRTAPAEHPFGLARAVLVELRPRTLALEPVVEGQPVGAVPRT